jgi:putative flippase GtrA
MARPTFVLSALVGAAATVVDLVTLWVLVEVVGLSPAIANVPALVLGVGAQFAGNKYLAFGDRSKDLLRQGGLFALVEAGALVLNALLFHALVSWSPLPYLAARLASSSLVYFAYSYPLWGRIFSTRETT